MSELSQHWLSGAASPKDMSDPLKNLEWALGQMLDAIEAGRYRYERLHVETDLRYLRGEVRRTKLDRPERSADA